MPYTFSADVWAFGCVLYEMVARAPPYIAVNQVALAEKICSSSPSPLPPSCPPQLQHLIISALQKAPAQRPSMSQCLQFVSFQASGPSHIADVLPDAQESHQVNMHMPLQSSSCQPPLDLPVSPQQCADDKVTCQVMAGTKPSAPARSQLNAVQTIVERLEAQNSPERLPQQSAATMDPGSTLLPNKSQSMLANDSGTGGMVSYMSSSAVRKAVAGDTAVPSPAAATSACAAVTAGPAVAQSTCSKQCVAKGADSSSCVGCCEAQHELKTLTCKVAGLQRLLASANQRAKDEQRNSTLLRRQRDRLQTALLQSGIPGAEWLAGSPIRSPNTTAPALSPPPTTPSKTTDAQGEPEALAWPAKHAPLESPTLTPATMSQFQAACALLEPTTLHAESGSTSSPLVMCPTAGQGLSQQTHAQKYANLQSPRTAQKCLVPSCRTGHAPKSSEIASISASLAPHIRVETGGAAQAGKLRALASEGVPLQTPRRQHARAHVATPIDLQKLLQGNTAQLGQHQRPQLYGAQVCKSTDQGSRTPVRTGPADKPSLPHKAVAKVGQGEVGRSDMRSGAVYGRCSPGTKQAAHAAITVPSSVLDHKLQHRPAPVPDRSSLSSGTGASDQLADRQKSGMLETVDKEGAMPNVPAASNRDSVAKTSTGYGKAPELAPANTSRLGVGACIPAAPVAASPPVHAQERRTQTVLPARVDMDTAVGLGPGGVHSPGADMLQRGAVEQQGRLILQADAPAVQPTAVQSLWLWADQPVRGPNAGQGMDTAASEQENIAPDDVPALTPSHSQIQPHPRAAGLAANASADVVQQTSSIRHTRDQAGGIAHGHGRSTIEAADCLVSEHRVQSTEGMRPMAGNPVPTSHGTTGRPGQSRLDALYAGFNALQTPAGRSKAAASYTATPKTPRTPHARSRATSRGATTAVPALQSSEHATPRAPVQEARLTAPVAVAEVTPRPQNTCRLARSPAATPRSAMRPTGVALLSEGTPVRPQSVAVGGSMLRTPPEVRMRAYTAAVAGELQQVRHAAAVADSSRQKLNGAFRRTSALLQRCKGPSDIKGGAGGTVPRVSGAADSKPLSTGTFRLQAS
eukprot:jgi/Ulvmu1/7176/UM034_0085.1